MRTTLYPSAANRLVRGMILAACLVAFLTAACSREPEEAPAASTASPPAVPERSAVPVQVPAPPPAQATQGTSPPGDAAQTRAQRRASGYIGVVLARQAMEVSSEGEGRLSTVDVRVGDPVHRGDRLASVETQDLSQDAVMAQATLRSAAADERRAEAELQKAREQYARRQSVKDLFSKEAIEAARTDAEVAAAALDTARARVAQERARLQQLQSRLSRSVLRSPIEGRVALRYLDPGALVHSGTPVVRLISSQDFLLRFAVPPEKANELRVGRRVAMRLESPEITLSATVSQIAPQVDPASQMVFIEAELELPAGWKTRLQDGLAGRVSLQPV